MRRRGSASDCASQVSAVVAVRLPLLSFKRAEVYESSCVPRLNLSLSRLHRSFWSRWREVVSRRETPAPVLPSHVKQRSLRRESSALDVPSRQGKREDGLVLVKLALFMFWISHFHASLLCLRISRRRSRHCSRFPDERRGSGRQKVPSLL